MTADVVPFRVIDGGRKRRRPPRDTHTDPVTALYARLRRVEPHAATVVQNLIEDLLADYDRGVRL